VNILAAAARSGAECVHAGTIGTGPNGDLVRATLAAEGVAWTADPVEGQDTALCVVLVEPSGERTFVTMQGAERALTVEALASSLPEPGDLVCVTGYSLAVASTRDPLLAWLAALPEGVEVVLDPGAVFAGLPDDVRARALAATTVWTSNQEEATALAGGEGMAESVDAVGAFLPRGAVVIVRDGPAGCAVRAVGATTVVPGFPQRPVDTNGAGDAHTGVLAAEVAAGTGWVEACRRANVAGAITVTRLGPATAPTAAEIDAFLAAVVPDSAHE
jgi:sugar/nucleoside kinase (ribokinase family)